MSDDTLLASELSLTAPGLMLALAPVAKTRTLGPQGLVDCISNRNHSQLKEIVRRPSVMLEHPYSADVDVAPNLKGSINLGRWTKSER